MSADVGLGVPFNIASYSFLLHMVAQQVNMIPEQFVWMGGDVHIYLNHVVPLKEQLEREDYIEKDYPELLLAKKDSITDYRYEDFDIIGYNPAAKIKMEVAV